MLSSKTLANYRFLLRAINGYSHCFTLFLLRRGLLTMFWWHKHVFWVVIGVAAATVKVGGPKYELFLNYIEKWPVTNIFVKNSLRNVK